MHESGTPVQRHLGLTGLFRWTPTKVARDDPFLRGFRVYHIGLLASPRASSENAGLAEYGQAGFLKTSGILWYAAQLHLWLPTNGG